MFQVWSPWTYNWKISYKDAICQMGQIQLWYIQIDSHFDVTNIVRFVFQSL